MIKEEFVDKCRLIVTQCFVRGLNGGVFEKIHAMLTTNITEHEFVQRCNSLMGKIYANGGSTEDVFREIYDKYYIANRLIYG